jgi:hypothetical protein
MTFAGMKLAMIPMDLIVQTRANYKKMSPEQFAALRASIQTFGWRSFVVVRSLDDGTFEIIDGHHRYEFAKGRGMVELPCVILDENTELSELARFSFNVAGEVLPDVMLSAIKELDSKYGTTDAALYTGMSETFVAGLMAQAESIANDAMVDLPSTKAEKPSKAAEVEAPKLTTEALLLSEAIAHRVDGLIRTKFPNMTREQLILRALVALETRGGTEEEEASLN